MCCVMRIYTQLGFLQLKKQSAAAKARGTTAWQRARKFGFDIVCALCTHVWTYACMHVRSYVCTYDASRNTILCMHFVSDAHVRLGLVAHSRRVCIMSVLVSSRMSCKSFYTYAKMVCIVQAADVLERVNESRCLAKEI